MEAYQTKNLDKGHIALFGEVDDEMVQTLIEQLIYLEGKRSVREVTLWINSTGGLLLPAFGLADVMGVLATPIRTIGLGTVESAATVVLTSGTRGRRLMTPTASMMLHEYAWSNSGSMTEMRGRMTEIKNTARKQVEHLSQVTGRPEAEVRKLLRHEETWLDPARAQELGLVDGVMDFNPVTKVGVPGTRKAPARKKAATRRKKKAPARPAKKKAPRRKR